MAKWVSFRIPCGCHIQIRYELVLHHIDNRLETKTETKVCARHHKMLASECLKEKKQEYSDRQYWNVANVKNLLGFKLTPDEEKVLGIINSGGKLEE